MNMGARNTSARALASAPASPPHGSGAERASDGNVRGPHPSRLRVGDRVEAVFDDGAPDVLMDLGTVVESIRGGATRLRRPGRLAVWFEKDGAVDLCTRSGRAVDHDYRVIRRPELAHEGEALLMVWRANVRRDKEVRRG